MPCGTPRGLTPQHQTPPTQDVDHEWWWWSVGPDLTRRGAGFFMSPIFCSRLVVRSSRRPAVAAIEIARIWPPVSNGARPFGQARCLFEIWPLL